MVAQILENLPKAKKKIYNKDLKEGELLRIVARPQTELSFLKVRNFGFGADLNALFTHFFFIFCFFLKFLEQTLQFSCHFRVTRAILVLGVVLQKNIEDQKTFF